jgi:hypothetical protein
MSSKLLLLIAGHPRRRSGRDLLFRTDGTAIVVEIHRSDSCLSSLTPAMIVSLRFFSDHAGDRGKPITIETNEAQKILATGSDGKVHDIHKIDPSTEGDSQQRAEWYLSTGAKLVTEDEITFAVFGEDFVLTRLGS